MKQKAADLFAEFKRVFTGGIELGCFMPHAIKKFGHSHEEVIRSFMIYGLFLPIEYISIALLRNITPSMQDSTLDHLFHLGTMRIIFMQIIILFTLYVYCKINHKLSLLGQSISALNWGNLLPNLFITPLVLFVLFGFHNMTDLSYIGMMFQIYYICLQSFIITTALQLRWPAGTALALLFYFFDTISISLITNPL